LALAVADKGRLATFDRRLSTKSVRAALHAIDGGGWQPFFTTEPRGGAIELDSRLGEFTGPRSACRARQEIRAAGAAR
jgi:hypothetical protein